MMKAKGVSALAMLLLLGQSSFSQVNDAGLWLGANVKLELNKRFSLGLSQQLRLDQTFTHFDQYFVQPEVGYGKKGIKVGFAYRLAIKSKLSGSTALRHRYHLNLGYKHKVKKLSLSTRLRFQQIINPIRGSERLPNGYNKMIFRQKFAIKYNKSKKARPFIQFEYFLPLMVSQVAISRLRYRLGVDIDMSKKQSITLFYTFQHDRLETQPVYSHTLGVAYSILSKVKKKK